MQDRPEVFVVHTPGVAQSDFQPVRRPVALRDADRDRECLRNPLDIDQHPRAPTASGSGGGSDDPVERGVRSRHDRNPVPTSQHLHPLYSCRGGDCDLVHPSIQDGRVESNLCGEGGGEQDGEQQEKSDPCGEGCGTWSFRKKNHPMRVWRNVGRIFSLPGQQSDQKEYPRARNAPPSAREFVPARRIE